MIRGYVDPLSFNTRRVPRRDNMKRGLGRGHARERDESLDSDTESFSENPSVAYRGLNDSEVAELYSSHGFPTFQRYSPNPNITVSGHVSRTLKDTPFISLSRSLKPAVFFASQAVAGQPKKNSMVARINLNALNNKDITDLTEFNNLNQHLRGNRSILNAEKAQEIIVKAPIPHHAVEGYYDINPLTKEAYDDFRNNPNKPPNSHAMRFYYHHTNPEENLNPHRFYARFRPASDFQPQPPTQSFMQNIPEMPPPSALNIAPINSSMYNTSPFNARQTTPGIERMSYGGLVKNSYPRYNIPYFYGL